MGDGDNRAANGICLHDIQQFARAGPQQFRTGYLNIYDIAANAQALTQAVVTEVQRRGGALVPVPAARSTALVRSPSGAMVPAPGAEAAASFWTAKNMALMGIAVIVVGGAIWYFTGAPSEESARARYA